MGLAIKKELEGSTVILSLHGVLDISTTNQIDSYLENLEKIDVFVFDFSELEFIDSTGIGSILNAIYLSQDYDFKIRLQGISEMTHQVFEMVGLYQIVNAFHGEVVQ
ncbi:STAS domain-containing protein [Bacillus ginsengihumi]|uniref:STAS domain-containing protein n=1 Tax=Heyndrickxia ginsengihumi TaxID=363870 RepID=A0A6M0P499_9BACI|nr:STAS domain-containing protein [Heyndrickxia ginsengihumi]NEY19401.1 STAS domain-containing protein [Heyndrickxia ginsengihumi]